MVAYFPAHNPRYTVLTTIHTKRQAGNPTTAARSGPVVKKVVTYLYNREHDWDLSPENSGENTIPGESKAATSPRSAASPTNSRPHLVRRPQRLGNGTDRLLSNVTISTLAQDDQTMPNVVGMGLKDALFLLESRGLRVSSTRLRPIPKHRSRHADLARGAVTITLK